MMIVVASQEEEEEEEEGEEEEEEEEKKKKEEGEEGGEEEEEGILFSTDIPNLCSLLHGETESPYLLANVSREQLIFRIGLCQK